MSEQKTAIVTGASSGFGKLIAGRLAESGYAVIGTSRTPGETNGRFEMRALELTSEESIESFVAGVIASHGNIDLLVNNAGRSQLGLIEETPDEIARQMFEINFWGPSRLNRRLIPLMRDEGGGLVVHVGSLAGTVGTPGQGWYAAAKHALDGYLETLRAELSGQSVEVCVVEPGFYRTRLGASMVRETVALSAYDSVRAAVTKKTDTGFAEGADPEEVADAVMAAVADRGRQFRRFVGKEAKTISRLRRWLPESWFLGGLRKNFGLADQ